MRHVVVRRVRITTSLVGRGARRGEGLRMVPSEGRGVADDAIAVTVVNGHRTPAHATRRLSVLPSGARDIASAKPLTVRSFIALNPGLSQ